MITGFAWITLPVADSESICIAQGVIVTFSQIASFVWTASIAVVLYIMIVKKISGKQFRNLSQF